MNIKLHFFETETKIKFLLMEVKFKLAIPMCSTLTLTLLPTTIDCNLSLIFVMKYVCFGICQS